MDSRAQTMLETLYACYAAKGRLHWLRAMQNEYAENAILAEMIPVLLKAIGARQFGVGPKNVQQIKYDVS